MPYYVLLSFDNDNDAKDFVKAQLKEDHTDTEGSPVWAVPQLDTAQVRGVYKKPTKFCHCATKDKARGWTRGKKYGWWVCSTCGLPSEYWSRGDMWETAVGTNLIPVECLAKPEWRNPTWKSDMMWTFLLEDTRFVKWSDVKEARKELDNGKMES